MLLAFNGKAQSVYSKQNLEKATQEDLNVYLQKAKKTRTIGLKLSITGTLMVVSGFSIANNTWGGWGWFGETNDSLWGTGVIVAITGISATLVGLPLLIEGSTRVKRIKEIQNTAFNGVEFDLAPCIFYNPQPNNHPVGITIKVSF